MRRANTNNKNNRNRNRNRNRRRTRRQKIAIASKWDLLQTPIIIEVISWLDQESLMNLSLVSKQLHDIIATTNDEPGNKNKIRPVFEVSGCSALKFCQNLQKYFLNKETKNKLQRYQIMRFKDSSKFQGDQQSKNKLREMVKNVQMNGITSLYLSSSSSRFMIGNDLLLTLPNIFPKLQELDLSNVRNNGPLILEQFLNTCPLLEKVTSNNDWNHFRISSCSIFVARVLERVSIRNMNWKFYFRGDDDYDEEDQKLIFIQDALIKFVRNAPPTLHWFRSDLTPDNMTMLRMERPGIELLN
ncbi:hypothetical protein FRACYDRAFT_247292 [Fragilariopsis cylindrus CCMP1102]|uniref:F-box domain-containing protein n=1 Tax=Fragilariopsis cylindrus CCMP1102 TaxID=635003 RepID=A0A1E7EWP7_9STRA|nr:hypothetical protein FRACYDRAFT_247292 [Fragilariopsis cylindrus CCMP1102]|eukprot:OEU10322.1 hypothetical protein FRACYDRAFT_247292 [Fragilariopsis cylindrus CCMP1102]